MTSGITLKKGKPSKIFYENLRNYYETVERGSDYATFKWGQWLKNPDIVAYTATVDHKAAGWIIYNTGTSTIEEILATEKWKGKEIEPKMVDALIVRENLIAAEVLKTDAGKYRWMVEYGFRPIRTRNIDGLLLRKLELSTSVLFRRLAGVKPCRPYMKKERVAIEKIPETRSEREIKRGLKNLIDNLGGLGKFVKKGQSVVIKPNLVSDHGMQDGVCKGGIVTDVRLVRTLIELLLPVAGKIIIAEGSSINRSATGKMFTLYGYDRLVEMDPEKISLVDLNTDELVEKAVPGEKRMSSRKIPLTIENADVIINVPVLKMHFAATVSLSVKSLQGAVPPLEKYMSHFFGLWQSLVNIHHLVKPDLIIIDGLTGQEGFGPVSGTPKKMDLLIGGTNPVAVDAVAMRVMGLDPVMSPPVWMAYMQGLGSVDPDRIAVIGPSIDEVASPFKLPEINIGGGRDISVHAGNACSGCRGYLHFVLNKLRRGDPRDASRFLIDRPFDKKVHIYLGPDTEEKIDPGARNIFMGICQQHNAEMGVHLPGCPPHAEVIMNGIFSLFPDVERPKYADETEEAKLGKMLEEVLAKHSS
ncbi:MAG: DUF362 domain-containing protein [Syntrophorhabdaceae bacterium]|nr:DUF362 domain-containing protein [Syntrophorhabdaceae bacterium]